MDTGIELVRLALDACLMRQTAIANNIANINSPDYQAIGVSFEEQLKDMDLQNLESKDLKPSYQQQDTKPSLENEMLQNIENMTHYRALIKGLNQHLSLMKLALQGNNQS